MRYLREFSLEVKCCFVGFSGFEGLVVFVDVAQMRFTKRMWNGQLTVVVLNGFGMVVFILICFLVILTQFICVRQ